MLHRPGCICGLANPPRPGNVKTRLIPLLGATGAARLAEAFLRDTWTFVQSVSWAEPILAASENDALMLELAGEGNLWLQGSGDLGERLERVLQQALAKHTFAIALGSDTPGLPRRFLESARASLEDAEAVVGPARDGGFYLLGMRRCPPGVLGGIPWSSGETAQATVARLTEAGLSVQLLKPWWDVDRPEDVNELDQLIRRRAIEAPCTARVLSEWTLTPHQPKEMS